jgi:lambda family phage minor tail protein L
MDASGFAMTTRGAIPQPTIVISNLFGAGNLLLAEYQGLIGATLIRILTLRRFLDDGSTPDVNAWITRDEFVVAQKTSHNALAIVFKLASRMDLEGVQLPRRQILRDVCSHAYRFWNPIIGDFDYSLATCPYTGGGCFGVDNAPTDQMHDVCQRTLQACKLRFGEATLPARFFPGVGKVK